MNVTDVVQKVLDVFKAVPGTRAIALGSDVHAIVPATFDQVDLLTDTFKRVGLAVKVSKHNDMTKQFLNADGTLPVSKVEARPGDFLFTVQTAGPSSAVTKRIECADGARRDTVNNELPKGWIEKDSKLYMPGPDGMVEVDRDAYSILMDRLAGKGTSSEEMFPTPGNANFPSRTVPMAADGHPANVTGFPKPYERDEVGETGSIMFRAGLNYILKPIDPGIADPEPFDAPDPGPSPATGDAPVDFQTDVSPIFKSMGAHKVRKGTFAGTIPDQHGTPLAPSKE